MTTLVVGATGLLGQEICRRLGSTHRVRAMVRATSDASKRAELEALGVELVEGDLKDPASLTDACAGVQSVVSTASSTFSRQDGDSIETVDHQGQLSLVRAARDAQVEHFVFVSFSHQTGVTFPLGEAKRAVEQELATSGMAWTILQSSYFMEIWLSPHLGFDPAAGKARIYGDGNSRISWISFRDVARVAAASLDEPAARNRTIEVGGPEALSPAEVVRMFEIVSASDIAVEHVPEADLEAQLAVETDPLQKSFAGLMLQYARGDAMDVSGMKRLFPFRFTPVRDYATIQLAQA